MSEIVGEEAAGSCRRVDRCPWKVGWVGDEGHISDPTHAEPHFQGQKKITRPSEKWVK